MKLKPHKPIREKYNPTPSAKEKRFHLALMQLPCLACGLEPCGVAHHILTDTVEKRWRRDHEMMLPLCDPHHRELHSAGSEVDWCEANGIDPIGSALLNRQWGKQKGYL